MIQQLGVRKSNQHHVMHRLCTEQVLLVADGLQAGQKLQLTSVGFLSPEGIILWS